MTRPHQVPCDILVVEDNIAVREVLREVLREEGYQVHSVIHGQDALEYLSETATLPHVILLDLMMPIMTGWEFRALQRENDRLRDIPVIVLSAVVNNASAQQLASLNALTVLTKPINWGELLNVIAQAVPTDMANVHGFMTDRHAGQQPQLELVLAPNVHTIVA